MPRADPLQPRLATATWPGPSTAVLQGREQVLRQLLGGANWRCPPWIEPPFSCNYGFNLRGECHSNSLVPFE